MSYELTDEQKLVCAMAVGAYGPRAQWAKMAEELRELAAEVDAYLAGQVDWDALNSERADVAVMLFQFDSLLFPKQGDFVRLEIGRKVERLACRLWENFMNKNKENES